MALPLIVHLFLLLQQLSMTLLQQPSLAVQQQQDAKASIEGVVVRIGSGEPIAGAELKLTRVAGAPDGTPGPTSGTTPGPGVPSAAESIGPPVPPTTASDLNGRFIFKDVDAGSYRISAARNGYAKLEYGQRDSKGTGSIIPVARGQGIKDIVFRLTPAGSVNGSVRDVSGEPLTGFQVLLLRSAYNPTGRRSFQTAGSVRTDDRGAYRFYWVTPGRYYLSAGLGNGPYENAGLRNPNQVEARPYPMTYYPGTLDPAMAQAVDILPGEELNGIEFVLPKLELYRIRGKIVDTTTGKPAGIVELRMAPRQSAGPSNIPPGYNNPLNGTFEFRDVAPGSYWIFATTQPEIDSPIAPSTAPRTAGELIEALIFSAPAAQAAVDISASDVENLVLTLTRGLSIRGLVRMDSPGPPAFAGFQNIQIMLQPAGPMDRGNFPRPLAPDGTFLLNNVQAGEYRLQVVCPGCPPSFYVREARLNSVDVLHQPLVVSNTEPGPLEVVISLNAGQIEGTVLDDQSQPVPGVQTVLIPDRLRERFETYKTAVTDSNGHFIIRGIEPGEYRVFAWEAIEEYAYFDPDILRAFEQQGKPVSVSESSKQTVDVKVIPAR
jgi:hypothetical protein